MPAMLPALPPTCDVADRPARLRLHAVWISDLHLGAPGCEAVALLDFLRAWSARPWWRHHRRLAAVPQLVLAAGPRRRGPKAGALGPLGHRLVFVPGNHDEFARRNVEHNFGGLDVVEDGIQTLSNGRDLWMPHSDLSSTGICEERLAARAGHAAGRPQILHWSHGLPAAAPALPELSVSRHDPVAEPS